MPSSEQPRIGDRVRVWPGARPEGRWYEATVIHDTVVFCGHRCVRVQDDIGLTDYIALTHVERIESGVAR